MKNHIWLGLAIILCILLAYMWPVSFEVPDLIVCCDNQGQSEVLLASGKGTEQLFIEEARCLHLQALGSRVIATFEDKIVIYSLIEKTILEEIPRSFILELIATEEDEDDELVINRWKVEEITVGNESFYFIEIGGSGWLFSKDLKNVKKLPLENLVHWEVDSPYLYYSSYDGMLFRYDLRKDKREALDLEAKVFDVYDGIVVFYDEKKIVSLDLQTGDKEEVCTSFGYPGEIEYKEGSYLLYVKEKDPLINGGGNLNGIYVYTSNSSNVYKTLKDKYVCCFCGVVLP